mgnify:CR=1 FL=1
MEDFQPYVRIKRFLFIRSVLEAVNNCFCLVKAIPHSIAIKQAFMSTVRPRAKQLATDAVPRSN